MKSILCTWLDPDGTNCIGDAEYSKLLPDGRVYAVLCQHHHEELEASVASGDAHRLEKAMAAARQTQPLAWDRMDS